MACVSPLLTLLCGLMLMILPTLQDDRQQTGTIHVKVGETSVSKKGVVNEPVVFVCSTFNSSNHVKNVPSRNRSSQAAQESNEWRSPWVVYFAHFINQDQGNLINTSCKAFAIAEAHWINGSLANGKRRLQTKEGFFLITSGNQNNTATLPCRRNQKTAGAKLHLPGIPSGVHSKGYIVNSSVNCGIKEVYVCVPKDVAPTSSSSVVWFLPWHYFTNDGPIKFLCKTWSFINGTSLECDGTVFRVLKARTINVVCDVLSDERRSLTNWFPRKRHIRQTDTASAVSGKAVEMICPLATYNVKDIKWEKGGQKLPINFRQQVHQNGSLVISNVQKTVDEGAYVCSAKDSEGRTHRRQVSLHVIVGPTISPFEFPSDFQVGMRLKVLCAVLRGDPPLQITWLKDGLPLPADQGLRVQIFKDYSMLTAEKIRVTHAGNYTCLVNNEAGSTSYSSILRVNAPPKWEVEPQDKEVVQGNSVKIDCSASGFPAPFITWKKATGADPWDFVPVYNSLKHTIFGNGTLFINEVGRTDGGFYLCQASNKYGADLGKRVELVVHVPPKFEIKFKAHAVKKGDSARMACEAHGDLPVEITWTKDGDLVKQTQSIRIDSTESVDKKMAQSSLIIPVAQTEYSGIYSCHAVNSYGEDETRIQLLVQEAPGTPGNISLVNETGRSVALAWSEPSRGNSMITKYLVQYQEMDEGETQDILNVTVPGTQVTAVVEGLKPASSYRFRVAAENSVGWSNYSEWVPARTEEEAPAGPPVNVSARATGPNSIKLSWQPPNKALWNGEIKGYYVGYRPVEEKTSDLYKTVESDGKEKPEVHLTNLRRSTSYVAWVQAFNGKGTSPRSDEVVVKTLDDVPPSAPFLKTISATTSSITLGWTQATSFGNPITEFTLHQRQENEPWKQTSITTYHPQYTVKDLDCGRSYQFFMTAHNSVGKSEPSAIVRARTEGAAPLSPSTEDLIRVGSTQTVLRLRSWRDGGCPITSYTIKLRQKFQQTWRTLVPNFPPTQSQYILNNLAPGTWYELEITAHSSAGATEAQYEFRTWNSTEDTSIQSPSDKPQVQSTVRITDLEILIPIVVSSFVVIVIIIVGCCLCSRDSTRGNRADDTYRNPREKSITDALAMKELASPNLECVSSEDGTQRSSSQSTSHYPASHSPYYPRPDEDETHSYATPYDNIALTTVAPEHSNQASASGMKTLTRKGNKRANNNIYISRLLKLERQYEALTSSTVHPGTRSSSSSEAQQTVDV